MKVSGVVHGRAARIGFGVIDQAICSLTNFFVQILVARSTSIEAFGAFALAFTAYTLAVTICRSLSTEPLTVRYPVRGVEEQRHAAGSVAGTAVTLGLLILLACGLVSFVVPDQYRLMVLAMGAVMPALLLQDAWRFIFLALGAPARAVLNDGVWLVSSTLGLLIASRVTSEAYVFLLVWGSAAGLAALIGIAQARVIPAARRTLSWLRQHGDLISRYLGESIVVSGGAQLQVILLSAVAGLGALGQFRLIGVAMGPINILVVGLTAAMVPEAVRSLDKGQRFLDRTVLVASLVLAAAAGVWGLAVGSLPREWTSWLVGDAWVAAASLLLPATVAYVIGGLQGGATMGLRVLQRANTSLVIRAVTSLAFGLSGLGGFVGGAMGASWANAGVTLLSAVLWWLAYRSASMHARVG
ncbi:hypothetical protein [Mobilicoccus sp.]|uniref:hypothetical protein n=1 Tax=Mobilicoccus sp. TaxID=2034349 RepID=UPI0028AAC869|nr:hypothetical protein [Mobilicoccus sp.]